MVEDNPIVNEAQKWLGHPWKLHNAADCSANPYEHGMDPAEGFDCSAFVRYVLLNAGLRDTLKMPQQLALIRHCDEFFRAFGMAVHPGLRQPGDLVFFTYKGHYPQHMGIMLDKGHYIHASRKAGQVVVSRLVTRPLARGMHPLQLYLTNPIGFKRVAEADRRWTVPVSW